MPENALPAALRRDRISTLIRERGFVRVAELSRIFRTSPVTIRSDLDHLEQLDLVRRVHGGAVSTSGASVNEGGAAAIDPKAEAKAAIGAAAAALVASGQTLILASGTTTRAVARALVQRDDLRSATVVTNGLEIALELQRAIPRLSVIMTGGTLRADAPALADPLGDRILQDIRADLSIVGCKGISLEGGVSDGYLPSISLDRRLLAGARQRVVVADSTKVGATATARIWDARDVDVLITEASSDPAILAELRDAGVKIETVR